MFKSLILWDSLSPKIMPIGKKSLEILRQVMHEHTGKDVAAIAGRGLADLQRISPNYNGFWLYIIVENGIIPTYITLKEAKQVFASALTQTRDNKDGSRSSKRRKLQPKNTRHRVKSNRGRRL